MAIVVALLTAVSLWSSGAHAQEQDEDWSEPRRLSAERWAWYPTIAVDSTGVAHALWVTTSEGHEDLAQLDDAIFYSRWDGVSWSQPVDVLVSPGGARIQYPAVVGDRRGALHAIWSGPNLLYSRALAGAAASARSWSEPVPLTASAVLDGDIVADDIDVLHIVYPESTAGIYYVRSAGGGDSWSLPVEVSIFQGVDVGFRDARLAVDAKHRIHVIWTQVPLPDGYPPLGVYHALSTDDGKTWSFPIQVAGENYAEGNVVTFGEDTVHLMWHGRVGIGGTYHQWSSDGGVSWTAPAQTLGGAGLTGAPAVAADSAGALYLAEVTPQGIVSARWTEAGWSVEEVVEEDTVGGVVYGPHYPALAVSRGSTLLLVWTRQGVGDVAFARLGTLEPHGAPTSLATLAPTPPVDADSVLNSPPPGAHLSDGGMSSIEEPGYGDDSVVLVIAGVAPAALLIAAILVIVRLRSGPL